MFGFDNILINAVPKHVILHVLIHIPLEPSSPAPLMARGTLPAGRPEVQWAEFI